MPTARENQLKTGTNTSQITGYGLSAAARRVIAAYHPHVTAAADDGRAGSTATKSGFEPAVRDNRGQREDAERDAQHNQVNRQQEPHEHRQQDEEPYERVGRSHDSDRACTLLPVHQS